MRDLEKKTLTTVSALLEQNKSALAMALPRHLTVERVIRVALSELRTNDKLLQCEPASLVSAIVKSSQVGLEIGSALGQAYLVPYGREATLVVGYRGFIALARRSGEIESLTARVVYAGDVFELEYGLEEKLRHIPSVEVDRGEITHVYAIARLRGGGKQYEVMTRPEVDAIRSRSRAGGAGPWVTDYPEMSRKTVVRRLFKYLPVSIEMADALEVDQDAIVSEQAGASAITEMVMNRARGEKEIEAEVVPFDAEEAEEEVVLEWPKESQGGLIDIEGTPFNPEFHAASQNVTASNTWRMRRGYNANAYSDWLSLLEAEPEVFQEDGEERNPDYDGLLDSQPAEG